MSLAIREGRVLVAAPNLLDPNFFRTVVLVCSHEPEGGTFGLVLNRRTEMALGKSPDEDSVDVEPIWVGGPVEGPLLWILHRHPDVADPGEPVLPGVYFGSDPDLLRRLIARSVPGGDGALFRPYLGYAGWERGQLEAELEQKAWIVLPVGAEMIFADDPGRVWTELMVRAMMPWDEVRAARFGRAALS